MIFSQFLLRQVNPVGQSRTNPQTRFSTRHVWAHSVCCVFWCRGAAGARALPVAGLELCEAVPTPSSRAPQTATMLPTTPSTGSAAAVADSKTAPANAEGAAAIAPAYAAASAVGAGESNASDATADAAATARDGGGGGFGFGFEGGAGCSSEEPEGRGISEELAQPQGIP
jgi:hypothetical protein